MADIASASVALDRDWRSYTPACQSWDVIVTMRTWYNDVVSVRGEEIFGCVSCGGCDAGAK